MSTRRISVSIVYACPQNQWLKEFDVPLGTDVGELIELSGLLDAFPEISADVSNLKDLPVGIYAQRVSVDHILNDGDRVEVYRALKADPKEVRRQLAQLGKVMGSK